MKCLGVLLDDGLTWKEQVQSVRKRSFAGLAALLRARATGLFSLYDHMVVLYKA